MSIGLAYVFLALSIGFELVAASITKGTKGFTILKPTIICVLSYTICFYFFGLSLERIHVGIGYATWGAVGIIVTSIVGVLAYHEHLSIRGIVALIIIVISTITLNLFGAV